MYQLLELAKVTDVEAEGVNEAVIDIAEMTVTLGSKGPFQITHDCIQLPDSSQVTTPSKTKKPDSSPVTLQQTNSQTQSTSPGPTSSSCPESLPSELGSKRTFSTMERAHLDQMQQQMLQDEADYLAKQEADKR